MNGGGEVVAIFGEDGGPGAGGGLAEGGGGIVPEVIIESPGEDGFTDDGQERVAGVIADEGDEGFVVRNLACPIFT